MSLIKCTECGKEYSDNASNCPNCGNPTNGSNGLPNNSRSNKTSNNVVVSFIASLLSLVIVVGVGVFVYTQVKTVFKSKVDSSKYDTNKVYSVGDTLNCPNFDITIDSVQIKKKGTAIDSYFVINEPEWIGVILTVKNKGSETKTFYGSDVSLINSNGEVLDSSWMTYKIWGAEPLYSPELVPGGSKTGYIQFTNNDTNNSGLTLKVDCNTGLFDDEIIYKVNISQ